VTPKGGKDCFLPFSEGDNAIRLKISSPPENGKANNAILRLLATVLKLPKTSLQIVNGEKSRHKQIKIVLSSACSLDGLLTRLAHSLQTESYVCFRLE
jgi:uncharacterized protein